MTEVYPYGHDFEQRWRTPGALVGMIPYGARLSLLRHCKNCGADEPNLLRDDEGYETRQCKFAVIH